MWTVIRLALSALAGWAVSDVYNEYTATRQASAPVQSVKKNWVKWLVIGVGSAILLFLFAQIVKIFSPKLDILKKQ